MVLLLYSKLLIRQNLMKRAIKSNMDKNGGNNDIHLDEDILVTESSKQTCTFIDIQKC